MDKDAAGYQRYSSPFAERFASAEMLHIWSPYRRIRTWRRCWIALAEAEKELGLPIRDEQIEEMRSAADDIDFEKARAYEQKTRHDVMAHIHAYGDVAPQARPIIHLGATSCDITDNADLILLREALDLVLTRLVNVLAVLRDFADRWKDLPCLGYTHYQPAQLVTVGKRACLWAQDFLMDAVAVDRFLGEMRARGAKGATGTQASFLALFHGDNDKVKALDQTYARRLGFTETLLISGQTYPRKWDTQVLQLLAGIGESAHKMATDLRLLQNQNEIEEPVESTQVGSSAMAYKRNPMRCERTCALARYLIGLPLYGASTASVQWLERTLDDSAIRRIILPEGFLAADAVLVLCQNIISGATVYPTVIARHVAQELPFMATENILMAAVERGGDRQHLHEIIRRHAHEVARLCREEGRPNDLLERLANEPDLGLTREALDQLLDVKQFVGRAPDQVVEFLTCEVDPFLDKHRARLGLTAEVRV